MVAPAGKTNKTVPVVQQKSAGNTFFRKAGGDSFFGAKESTSFFGKPIQPKLTVSTPDDPHEKEADAVADKVMRMPEPVMASPAPEKKEELHRKEEEEVQAKQEIPVIAKIHCKANPNQRVQAKLNAVILRAGEKQIAAKLETASANSTDHSISPKNISLYGSDILRQSGRGPPVNSIPFEQTLSSSKGGGSPLPGSTQTFMESRFNADFSGVRIHTNDTAQNLTSQVNAQAFAHGNDIYFNSGKFSPHSTQGGTLLAHELTHTIQQGASKSVDRTPIKNNTSSKSIHKKTGIEQHWKTATGKGIKVDRRNLGTPDQAVAKKDDDIRLKKDATIAPKTNAQPDTLVAAPLVQIKAPVAVSAKLATAKPDIAPPVLQKKEIQQKEQEQENKENTSGSHEFLVSKKGISRSVIPELHKCPHCGSISRKPGGDHDEASRGYAGIHTCPACSIVLQASERGPPLTDGSVSIGHVQPDTLQRDDQAPPEKSWLDKLKDTFEPTLAALLPTPVYNFYSKIKNGGLLSYIKDVLAGLFKGLFGKLGFSEDQIQIIFEVFARLKSQLPAIIDGLSKGDCKPLFAALDLLSEVVSAIAGKMWDDLMAELEPVRLWLIDIWNTFGAPVVEEIKYFLGEEWEALKALGKFIWDSFKPIRDAGADAWDWVVKKLGFGTSDEPGLLSYVSGKLSEAWQNIKTELKPVIEPINDVVEGIKTLASLTDIQKLKEDAKKWLDEVVKTATAMGGDEDAVASKQLTLRQVMLPALNKSIDRLKGTLQSAADWLTAKISFITGKVTSFISGLQGNTYLAPMYPLIKWLPAAADKLKDWATNKVTEVFTKIQTSVDHLKKFVEPLLKLLEKLVGVASNLLGKLPDLILGVPFMFMPRCIKDPIIKWLTEVVLKQIPIIGDFIALTEKWEEIKTAALTVLKQVFVDGQLGKGLWTFFKELLKILGIDPKLVTKVIAKAAKNFSDIISKPGVFLKNIWNVIKGGFTKFWDNIGKHLLQGALDWLFGEVKSDKPVQLPKAPFSVGSILGFVLELFGITKDNVYERMRKNPRIGPEKVKKIQEIEGALTGALEWITVWIRDGPEGLLKKVKEKIGDLKNMVINAAVSWVTSKIAAEITKKLATSADPLGIGATINVIIQIYDAIKAAVDYFNRILNVVNDAMDNMAEIIAGNTDSASQKFEDLLGKAVPVVIGFAVEAVLGKVGAKITEVVDKVHKKIDDAIDWLINGALNVIDGIIATGKKVVGKIAGWLGMKKTFTSTAGTPHQMYFKKQADAAILILETTPKPVKTFLSDRKQEIAKDTSMDASKKSTDLGKIGQAEKLLKTLDELTYPKDKKAKPADDNELKIMDTSEAIVALLKELDSLGTGVLPSAVFNPGFNGAKGQFFEIRYVCDIPSKNYQPGEKSGKYRGNLAGTLDSLEKDGVRSKWVAFHIINDNYGGKATDSNLIAVPQYINTNYEVVFESKLKEMKTQVPIWMKFTSSYRSDIDFVERISATGGGMKYEGNQWVEDSNKNAPAFAANVDRPRVERVSVNTLVKDEVIWYFYTKETGLETSILDFIADQVKAGKRFNDKNDLITKMTPVLMPAGTAKTRISNLEGQVNKSQLDF